jgi:hypothetical protein
MASVEETGASSIKPLLFRGLSSEKATLFGEQKPPLERFTRDWVKKREESRTVVTGGRGGVFVELLVSMEKVLPIAEEKDLALGLIKHCHLSFFRMSSPQNPSQEICIMFRSVSSKAILCLGIGCLSQPVQMKQYLVDHHSIHRDFAFTRLVIEID